MVVNVGQGTIHGSYGVYVWCGSLPVTKVYEGLVRDPHIENAIIPVVTGILEKTPHPMYTCKSNVSGFLAWLEGPGNCLIFA